MTGGAAAAARQLPASGSAQRPADVPEPDNGASDSEGPIPDGRLKGQAESAYRVEWSPEEQKALEAALARFPADKMLPLERYLRIAASLPKKGARDVALRVKWMARTAQAKKRKAESDAALRRQQQQRRERGQSIFATGPKMGGMMGPGVGTAGAGMPPPFVAAPAQGVQALGMQLDNHGSEGVGGVEGPIASLLENNYAILNQFKQNMAHFKVNENTELLVRFRDNILTILNHMNSMQGVMSQMPALPVRLNVELANNFLPKAGQPFPIAMPLPLPLGPPGAVGLPVNGASMASFPGPRSAMTPMAMGQPVISASMAAPELPSPSGQGPGGGSPPSTAGASNGDDGAAGGGGTVSATAANTPTKSGKPPRAMRKTATTAASMLGSPSGGQVVKSEVKLEQST